MRSVLNYRYYFLMSFRMFGIDSVWCYPIACGVILGIHTGTYKMMSLLYVASIERYAVSRKDASFPNVLRILVEHMSGPLVGFLGCMFPIPHVILAGCVLASVSMGCCFFAESILTLNILWGVMYGLGCGMSRHIQPVFLSRHFKASFTQANGLSFLGGSVGGAVVPPIFEVLMLNYGLSGAFLIFSAISLHAVPAALILLTTKSSSETVQVDNEVTEENILFVKEIPKNSYSDIFMHETVPKSDDNFHTSSSPLSEYERLSESDSGTNNYRNDWKIHVKTMQEGAQGEDTDISESYLKTVLNRKYSTEISNVCSRIIGNSDPTPETTNENLNFWKVFIVFLDPLFQLIALTQSACYYALNIFLIIIIDFARDVGIDEKASIYIVILFGVGDTFSRIGLSWVIDKGYMTVVHFSALNFVLFGISFSAMTFTNNFFAIAILSFFAGVAMGVLVTNQPGIIEEFYEGEKKTMAMASRTFYSGPTALTISLLIGYFRESLGSYVWLIHFCSMMSIASGVISIFFPCIYRCRCRTKLS